MMGGAWSRAVLVAALSFGGGQACASRIATPPLHTHHLKTDELELRFGGFTRGRMGLSPLQMTRVYIDRLPSAWRVHGVALTSVHGAPCGSGVAAALIDTSAGRTAAGDVMVDSSCQLDAGFRDKPAENVCEAPCRLDILFEDHRQQPRCLSLQLTD